MIIFIFTFESLFMCTGADWRAVTGHWTGSRRVGQNFYYPKNFLFFSPHVYTGGINCAVTGRSTLSSRRGTYPRPVCHRGGHSTGRYRSLDSLKPAGARETYPRPVCMYGGGVTRLAVTGRSTLSSRLRFLTPGERLRLAYFMQTLSL